MSSDRAQIGIVHFPCQWLQQGEFRAASERAQGGLQLSLDGRRLDVTSSLYSTWDNQLYPGLRSWLPRVNRSPEGGMP